MSATSPLRAPGRVKVNIQITKNNNCLNLLPLANVVIEQNQVKVHTVTIPPGKPSVKFALAWLHGWEAYPTSDVDLLVSDPDNNYVLLDRDNDGDIDGSSGDVPERVMIANPIPGTWTLLL
jgi:hypothetical protein